MRGAQRPLRRAAARGPARLLRAGAVAAGALILVGLFVVLLFPYARLVPRLERWLEASTGRRVAIGAFGPGLGRIGPALVATDLTISGDGAPPLRVDELRLRPALAALLGAPALAVDARAPAGRAVGTLRLGAEPGFAGRLADPDSAAPPLAELVPGLDLNGRGEIDVRLTLLPAGPRGRVALDLHDGSIAHALLPLALPYTELRGEIEARDDGVVELREIALAGPMLHARLEGAAGPPDAEGDLPLDLRLHLSELAPKLAPFLRSFGIHPGADGTAELQITGSTFEPVIR